MKKRKPYKKVLEYEIDLNVISDIATEFTEQDLTDTQCIEVFESLENHAKQAAYDLGCDNCCFTDAVWNFFQADAEDELEWFRSVAH